MRVLVRGIVAVCLALPLPSARLSSDALTCKRAHRTRRSDRLSPRLTTLFRQPHQANRCCGVREAAAQGQCRAVLRHRRLPWVAGSPQQLLQAPAPAAAPAPAEGLPPAADVGNAAVEIPTLDVLEDVVPHLDQSMPLSVVIFGATGDLAKKKLFPALYQLMLLDHFPRHVNIVGYGRRAVVPRRSPEYASSWP